MRIECLAVIALLLGALAAAPEPYVAQKMKNASVRITFSLLEVKLHCTHRCTMIYPDSVCSGVVIGSENGQTRLDILTAAHCVAPSRDSEVADIPLMRTARAATSDGDAGRLVDSRYNDRDDVALATFDFSRPHHSVAAKYSKTLYFSQPLYAFGNPEAGDWLIQPAVYDGYQDLDDGGSHAWHSDYSARCRLCSDGDSGGGIWTDRGYLVGIMNAYGGGDIFYLPIGRVLSDLFAR